MRTCIRHSDPNWITPRSVYRGKRNGPHQGARTPSVQPPHCGRNSHTTPLAQHSVLIPTLLSGGLASSRASSRGRTHRSGLPVSAAQGLDKRKQAADWREQTKCQTKQVREAKHCSDRTATKKCTFTDTHPSPLRRAPNPHTPRPRVSSLPGLRPRLLGAFSKFLLSCPCSQGPCI